MRDYMRLPQKYHRTHDMCMSLIGQIEEFIINNDYDGLRIFDVKLPDGTSISEDEDILAVLIRIGLKDEHDRVIKYHIINALLSDICYFTQEALTCSLKQRLTVTFALLRKPFGYSMIVILRMLFEQGFIDRFNNEEKFDPAAVSPDERKELIEMSLQCMIDPEFTADEIINWIFDKQDPESLMNLSDQALHLSTTRNPHNLTGVQNFNFIFSSFTDIESQWEYLYCTLPALLLYLVQLTDMLVLTAIEVDTRIVAQRLTQRADFLAEDID